MITNFNASSGLSIGRANSLYVKNAGGSTIQSSGTGVVDLTIKAITSQTANLLEIKNVGGDNLLFVDSQGNINLYPYGASSGNTLSIRYYELAANGTNYVAFKGPDSIASNVTWTLPNTDGTNHQAMLTDSKGNLGWYLVGTYSTSGTAPTNPNIGDKWFNTATGALLIYTSDGTTSQWVELGPTNPLSPVGTNTQVQYNNSGSLAAAAGLTYSTTSGNTVVITSQSATDKALTIKGYASQSGNLITLQNSSSTTLASFDSSGNLILENQGDIRLKGSSSTYIGFQSPSTIASSVLFTLPDADGTPNQVLITDGSANLSWKTIAGTSAAGSNGQIQYNNSNAFDGAAALIYTTSGTHLTITAQTSTDVPLAIKGASSQTSNLFDAKDNSSASLFSLNSNGSVILSPYGTSAGNTNELRFLELAANGTNYVAFKASDSISTNITWVLPSADGSSNQVLKTDGSGALSWASLTAPSGSSGDLQFNNGGSFDATTGITYASSGTNLTIISQNAADKPLVIQGASSQSGNLLEINNNSSTNLFVLNSSGTVTKGIWNGTAVGVAYGGTNITSYTAGDLIYATGSTTLTKLPIGTNDYVLTSSGSAPQWVAQSTLTVGNATNSTNTSNIAVSDDTSTNATRYLTFVAATTGNNAVNSSSTKLTFNPSSGNLTATQLTGTLQTGAQTNITSVGTLTGLTVNGNITVNTQNSIRLADSDSSNYVGFKSAATVSSNITWTLPSADGSSGQVLQTDGSGTLSWVSTTSSAAGSSGQIQYNNGGNFAGAAGFTYATSADNVTITAQNTTDHALVVKGKVSQTANIQEWQNSSSSVLASIAANGYLTISPTASTGSQSPSITITAPAHTALTALTESPDVNFNFNRTVQFTNGNITTQRAFRIQAPTYAFTSSSTITNAATVQIDSAPVAGTNATLTNSVALRILTGTTTGVGILIQGPASGTANLQTFQADAGTTAAYFAANGALGLIPTVRTGSPANSILLTAPAHTALTASTEYSDIRFNLARTAEFATGAITTQRAIRVDAPTYAFVGSSTITNAVTFEITSAPVAGTNATLTNSIAQRINTGVTTAKGLVIQGVLSQSGNLQEFQNNSGTALSYVDSSGNFTLNGANSLRFIGTTNSNYLGFKAPATVTANLTWTLPSGDGSNGQVLGTNGSGTLSWVTPSTAAGSNGQVQYNNSGSLAGAAGLAYATSGFNITTTSQNAADVPLLVKGATSQSGNLQEWRNVGNSVLASISSNGYLTISPAASTGSQNPSITLTAPAHTALTASVESSDININLNRTVQFSTGSLTLQRAFRIQAPTYAFVGASTLTTAATMQIDSAPVAGTNATITNPIALRILTGTTTGVGILIQGPASGTANLQTFQADGGTTAAYFAANGALGLTPTVRTGSPANSILLTAPAHTALTASAEYNDIYFSLARTAQFSTGAITTQRAIRIDAPTYAFVGASTITNAVTMEVTSAPLAGTNATLTNAIAFKVSTGAATAKGILIQGAASQSGNLQELQNSSGTILALFDSSGNLKLNGQNSIRLSDSGSTNYVAFKAASTVASSVTWTLPSADGTANQVLTTNGSGTLSWGSPTPSGAAFTSSTTAPATPVQGDRWYDLNSGNLYTYIYDGNTYQWVR
jgi:hypothetical protein